SAGSLDDSCREGRTEQDEAGGGIDDDAGERPYGRVRAANVRHPDTEECRQRYTGPYDEYAVHLLFSSLSACSSCLAAVVHVSAAVVLSVRVMGWVPRRRLATFRSAALRRHTIGNSLTGRTLGGAGGNG